MGGVGVLKGVWWQFVCSSLSIGGGVVALESHLVRLVIVVLELVGKMASLVFLKIYPLMQWSSGIYQARRSAFVGVKKLACPRDKRQGGACSRP
jgi:hypothetical protein